MSDACDLLHGIWERGAGADGFVSIEVDPNLAFDRRATFEQAKELHERIDKPNLLVKIPGTEGVWARSRTRSPPGVRSTSRCCSSPATRKSSRRTSASSGSSRAAATPAESPRSRATSCPAWIPKRTNGWRPSSEEALALRKLAIANAKLAYQNYLEALRALEGARGEGRDPATLSVGVHLDEESRVP